MISDLFGYFLLQRIFRSKNSLELLLIIHFFQWQQYRNVTPFLYVGQHLSNKKIKNKKIVKKGGLGHLGRSYWINIFAPFYLIFIHFWKKYQKRFVLTSFNIWNKKYIFWGQNTLKMQANQIVRIALTFLPIFWSSYPKHQICKINLMLLIKINILRYSLLKSVKK